MDRNHGEWSAEVSVDQLIRKAFGMDDDQLMKDFLLAQTEIKDSQIPPEPSDGFERLLGTISERGLESNVSRNYQAADGSSHKVIHLRRTLKVAVLVAVLGVALAAMGITAIANRWFLYGSRERGGIGSDVRIENVETIVLEGTVERAYNYIFDELGIKVLKLGYMPQGMNYIKTTFVNGQATMLFEFNNKKLNLVQRADSVNIRNNIISDRNEYDIVFNKQLNQEISISKTVTVDEEIELNAFIIMDDTFYYLMGNMDEVEFEKILSEVYIEN